PKGRMRKGGEGEGGAAGRPRHAESRWNRAQASGDLISLLWENDHGLTEEGLRMAAALRQRIRATREAQNGAGSKADWASHFMSSDIVYSSPLTRALETTCVALKDDVIASKGVVVMREAREQKNSIGSVDSTGVAVGERIRDRVQEDLRAVLEAACEGTGETPEAPADRALADAWESLEALANLPLDTSGVEDEWWGPLSGDHEELRLHDTYLAFCLSSSRLLSFLPSQVCNTSCSSCSRATEENRA
ncbi:unnamed protein product, partial [Prorocentrum cordatum]